MRVSHREVEIWYIIFYGLGWCSAGTRMHFYTIEKMQVLKDVYGLTRAHADFVRSHFESLSLWKLNCARARGKFNGVCEIECTSSFFSSHLKLLPRIFGCSNPLLTSNPLLVWSLKMQCATKVLWCSNPKTVCINEGSTKIPWFHFYVVLVRIFLSTFCVRSGWH